MPFSLTASKTVAIVLNLIHSMLWMKTSLIMLYGWVYLLLSSPFKHKGTKTDMIQRDAKQLQKIPLHLAIVISEPQIAYVDLAKMINWAFILGVQFVCSDELCKAVAMFWEKNLLYIYGSIWLISVFSQSINSH